MQNPTMPVNRINAPNMPIIVAYGIAILYPVTEATASTTSFGYAADK